MTRPAESNADAGAEAPLERRRDAVAARQSSLREHNLAVVSQTVFASATPLSRARLAAETGMTRSTVSRLTEELVRAGLLITRDADGRGRPGRPAVPLAPAAGSVAGLGLHVNVDYMTGRVVDLTGAVLAEEHLTGDFEASDPADVLPRAGELAARLVARVHAAGARVARARLGLPGLVDAEGRRLLLAPNLGWRDITPAELLGDAALPAGVDLRVDNDAHLAAYGIAHAAPGRVAERNTFLYVAGDIGVGAAIVSRGQVVAGQHGWAGEIGHVSIEPDGPPCHCGSRGCLEVYTGKHAVLAAAGLPPTASSADLQRAVAEGHPQALAAVDRAAWALGVALASTVNIVDADEIVLGSGFVPFVDALRPGIEEQLRVRTLAAPWSSVTLRAAPPDDAPAATGGAMRALEAVIADPASWIETPVPATGTG